MPKKMKVLIVIAAVILLYLFVDVYVQIKTQNAEDYIVKLEVALQNAEHQNAVHSTELVELREDNDILRQENNMMSATLEGVMYQKAALDE